MAIYSSFSYARMSAKVRVPANRRLGPMMEAEDVLFSIGPL